MSFLFAVLAILSALVGLWPVAIFFAVLGFASKLGGN